MHSAVPVLHQGSLFIPPLRSLSFFRKRACIFSHTRALLSQRRQPKPRWRRAFTYSCGVYCLVESIRAWFMRFYIPLPVMSAKKTLETWLRWEKYLQMTWTQHSNTVWLPWNWNPLWKPYYSTLHHVSVVIKCARVVFAYRSQLFTVINAEVCFDAEND